MTPAKENQPTIYDVAKLSGLSISTISRVLNAPQKVSEATRAKVMAAIDQLQYTPQAEARARALQNTRRIGIITPFFTSPSVVQRLRGIDAALADHRYELIIYTVDSVEKLDIYLSTLPITGNLDGLVIISLPYREEAAERLVRSHLETVSIEYTYPSFSSVLINDVLGGRLAGRYLASQGHQRVGMIGDVNPPEYAIRPVVDRLQGLREGLEEFNIILENRYVCSASFLQEPTRRSARQLLSMPDRPTAIFAAADIQAIMTIRVAREMGLRVPEDVAVIGFDDLDIADDIGLTTIRQPLDDSGRLAAELLLSRLDEPERPVQHVQLPLSLIVRETA
ncbi:MAG: LacI family DNA-binding transcriptional regulator [Chloroflexota bacterium]